MAKLTFGISAQGAQVLKDVVQGLDQITTSAGKLEKAMGTGKLGGGASRSLRDIGTAAKSAQNALQSMVDTQQYAIRSLGDMSAAFGTALKGTGAFSADLYRATMATKALSDEAVILRRDMSNAVLGIGAAAEASNMLGGANYKLISSFQAQQAALAQMEAVHNKYVATLGRQILMEDKGAQAMMASTAAVEKNIAAMAKLQAMGRTYTNADDALKQVANMEALEKVTKDLEAQERKLASLRKASTAEYTAAKKQEEAAINRTKEAVMEQFFAQQKLDAANKGMTSKWSGAFTTYTKSVKDGEAAVRKLAGATDDLSQAKKALHDTLRGVSGAMGGLWMTYGQVLPLMAGYAAVAGTIKTVKIGAEFDSTSRSIQFLNTQLTGTKKPLMDIQNQILGMRDVVKTPQELADGLLEFTRAGVGVDEVFKTIRSGSTVFEEMVRFSTHAGTSMENTVKLITGQAAAFGTEFTDVANIIAKTADLSTADLSTMGEAFKNTTQLGTVLNVSFQDVAAALGVMHDAGIRGATAGAALTTALIRIADPSKKAQTILKEVNAEFSAFEEGSGKLKDLPTIFEDLAKATSQMNPKQFIDFMDELVGKRGVKAAGVLTREGAEEVDKGLKMMMASFGKSGSDVSKFGNEMRKYLEAFPEATGKGVEAFTYLQEVITASSESGQYQLKLLKADVERLFIQSYDNSSVVQAMKDLREVVTDPSTVEALRQIVTWVLELTRLAAKAIVITVDFAMGKTQGAYMGQEGYFTPEGGTIGLSQSDVSAAAAALEPYRAAVRNLSAELETLQAQQSKYSQSAGESSTVSNNYAAAISDTKTKLQAANEELRRQQSAVDAVTKSTVAGGVSNSEYAKRQKEMKATVEGSELATLKLKNAQEAAKMAAEAKLVTDGKVAAVQGEITKKIDAYRESLQAQGVGQLEMSRLMNEYEKNVRAAYSDDLAKAKKQDEAITGKGAAAHKAAAAAARENSQALQDVKSSIDVYTASLAAANKRQNEWNTSAFKAAEEMGNFSDRYATAGMTEVQRIQYENNKVLEEGARITGVYTSALNESLGVLAAADAEYGKAIDMYSHYMGELDKNPAIRSTDAASQKVLKLKTDMEEAGKAAGAAADATGALYGKLEQARTAMARATFDTTKSRKAWEEWGAAIAHDGEVSDSFWQGMSAGAAQMVLDFGTLGKLGRDVFEGITGAARTAASETADLVYDMITGKSDEAVDDLKRQYDENIRNLEDSLADGTKSQEEFEKERLALTEKYNEEVKAAHKGLWEQIGDIMDNLWKNILKSMLQIFIQWVAEIAMIWAAKQIFSGTEFGGWADALGKGTSILSNSGGGGTSGWGSAATGIGAAYMGYDYYNNLDSVSGGYGSPDAFNYNMDTGEVGNSFTTTDYASAGKIGYDAYGNVTRVGAAPAITGMDALGGAVGVAGGAYGLYSAAQQLANGTADWKTGVQAGLSGYSLYNGYNTVAGYMGGTGMQGLGQTISDGIVQGYDKVASVFSSAPAVQSAPQLYNAYQGYEGLQAGAEVAAAQTGAQIGAQAAAQQLTINGGTTFGASEAAVGQASYIGAQTAPSAPAAAMGATYGTAGFAVVSALVQYANSQKLKTYDRQAPTLGTYVPVEYGEDQLSATRRAGARYASRAAGAFDTLGLGQGGDDNSAPTFEEAQQNLDQAKMLMDGYIDILANDFGDAVAKAGMQLDGTVASTDRFLDSISGYDVSMQQSASITSLATAAAHGQSGAFNQLRGDLEALGMSSTAAETAATALIAGVDGFTASMISAGGEAINAIGPIKDGANAISSLGNAASSAGGAIDSETGAMLALDSGAAQATAAVNGMTSAVNTLSNTPLNIDVRVRQIAFPVADIGDTLGQTYHADGGIFPSTTLLRSRSGAKHYVGDKLPEAILPLHNGPDTLRKMDGKLDALANRPVVININGDAAALSRFIRVAVDQQVTDQARRGQLANRTEY